MTGTIILIAAFQCYWINRLYHDEWQNLKRESDVIFRDVVYKLQLQRFRSDTTIFKTNLPDNLFIFNVIDSVKEKVIDSALAKKSGPGKKQVAISVMSEHRHDSVREDVDFFSKKFDSFQLPAPSPGAEHIIKYFSSDKRITDTLSLQKLDSAYKTELLKNGITVAYRITRHEGKDSFPIADAKPDELKTNFAFTGLAKTYAYQAAFDNPFNFIISKIKFPILVSLLLIAVTIASFVFLYRNLLAQRRLAAVKNEFISNITHELKTPIATVNVAIEALRNFGGIQSPERTKEYLDISAAELHRLSLLVDNVLKLSMFENREIELHKEQFDLKGLVQEVINTMKLQFEKYKAAVSFTTEGESFIIDADKLHITSVIYNLLDNALKYSKENPVIHVQLSALPNDILELKVSDNGIGIPKEFRSKIFDKFFRVPSGDRHNIKGYGLGLSYVAEIVRRHMGYIYVESELDKGSSFIVKLPVKEAPVIYIDEHRRIIKRQIKFL